MIARKLECTSVCNTRVYRFVNGSAYFHTIAEHVAHDNSSSRNIDAEHVAHDNSNSSHTYPRDLSTTGQFTTISLDLQN